MHLRMCVSVCLYTSVHISQRQRVYVLAYARWQVVYTVTSVSTAQNMVVLTGGDGKKQAMVSTSEVMDTFTKVSAEYDSWLCSAEQYPVSKCDQCASRVLEAAAMIALPQAFGSDTARTKVGAEKKGGTITTVHAAAEYTVYVGAARVDVDHARGQGHLGQRRAR